MSVVRKRFIGQIQIYGNLPYNCSIQQKQLVLRDRMNSICPMNFFRTTDTTDTTIWKPGFSVVYLCIPCCGWWTRHCSNDLVRSSTMKLGRVKNLLWNVSNLRCLYCAHCGISCDKKIDTSVLRHYYNF